MKDGISNIKNSSFILFMTTELIKQLRDETGISVMQCKKALEEAGGDVEKARIILKKKSGVAASKKADRELASGFIASAAGEGKVAIVTLFCETDFVAKNEDFIKVAKSIAEKAITEGESAKESSSDTVNELIQKIGENIKIGDIKIAEGNAGSYVHNGQIAAVVNLKEKNDELARDIAMHITAMRPAFMNESDIDETAKENAKSIFSKEVEEQAKDKPEEMKTQILNGKLASFFKDQVLMKQSFVKDPSKTIEQLVKEANNEIVSYTLEQI
ncbi:MAG: elongation factor Ts [Patescibacteria group bacterium]|nr:elongation factor Ts [Patescibacteria group bacterium]